VERFRWLRLPAGLLGPTLLLTLAARFEPAVFSSLRRDPGALAQGELWRLVSPVLVQADLLQPDGLWRTLAVFSLVAALLAAAQRVFAAGEVVSLYALGALVGHGIGELWQPYGAGCSVAGCGVLGGVAVWLLQARPPGVKFGATLVLSLAVVATLLQDIHGPPLIAGAVMGACLGRRRNRRQLTTSRR
jgi:rhomboid protease GluP